MNGPTVRNNGGENFCSPFNAICIIDLPVYIQKAALRRSDGAFWRNCRKRSAMGAAASTTDKEALWFGKLLKLDNNGVHPDSMARLKASCIEAGAKDGATADSVKAVVLEECKKAHLVPAFNETENTMTITASPAANRRPSMNEEEITRALELVQRNMATWLDASKQTIVSFVDGSDRAHLAFETAKSLLKTDADELTVITVESEKEYLGPNYRVAAIRTRYESELTGFISSKRWRLLALPRQDNATTKDVVRDFVNHRDKMDYCMEAKEHPDPTFVVFGFSGRKSFKDRDPSVIGQVADLSLRSVFCPCIVVKIPAKQTHRHFVVLVEPLDRCKRAVQIVSNLLKPEDKLTLIHAPRKIETVHAKSKLAELFEGYPAIRFLEGDPSHWVVPHDRVVGQLQDADDFKDVDFVCVATRPRPSLGSMSDTLVRRYAGNIILVKDDPRG